jgi:hypothetical protein
MHNGRRFRFRKTLGALLIFALFSPAKAGLDAMPYSEQSHLVVSALYCLNYFVELDNSHGIVFYRGKLKELSKSMKPEDIADGIQLYFITENELFKKHGIRITEYDKRNCEGEVSQVGSSH